MNSQKFIVSRGSPRASQYPFERSLTIGTSKAMPNDLLHKPITSVIDRFRALLKQRDDELRLSGENDVPPPSTQEIVQLYKLLLSELTLNSKPIITDLTIVAGEHREHGEGIANAICSRILEAPVDQKLPSLYLLDSIVKNIGRDYIKYFSSFLPEVFLEAYRQVHPNLHSAMRHLFGTWSTVFPPSVLRKIEAQLQLSPSANQQSSRLTPSRASESPRPSHGIHVNPKYLRQLENSSVDSNIQHPRGTSNLKVYGQTAALGYDDYDTNNAAVSTSQVGTQIYSSRGGLDHSSFAHGANKLHSSSPSRIVPDRSILVVDELDKVNSPGRFAGRASPSHHVFESGEGRMVSRDDKTAEWRRKYSDDNQKRLETSTAYRLSNGYELQGPRALIDAYGSDSGKRSSNDNSLQVERYDINGIDNKVAPITWQNTEEEEFDWEDMSPTLADRGRNFGFRSRPGYGGELKFSPSEPGMRTSWSSQAQLPAALDSSSNGEDAIPSTAFGRGSRTRSEGNHNLGSHYPQEAWNTHNHPAQLASLLMNAKGEGRNFQIPLLGRGGSSIDRVPADGALSRPLTMAHRMGSSGAESSNFEVQPVVQSLGLRAPINLHNSSQARMHSVFPLLKQGGSQFDSVNDSNSIMIQHPNKSSFIPDQRFYSIGGGDLSSKKQPQFTNQNTGPFSLGRGNLVQTISSSLQFHPSDNYPPSTPPVLPHLVTPTLSQGLVSQRYDSAISLGLSHAAPLSSHNIPYGLLHLHGGTLPPLHPGPHPASTQIIPLSQNSIPVAPGHQPGTAYSGLISSCMAQGLITLTNHTSVQESVGLEFNDNVLKVRHESAISALYDELPRQCTTCGLRFKSQEEHSNHMDWHVTKNRMSKNRKQKSSRKWFVSTSMWLSGAEALGTEAVPGFLPTETVVEKKDDEDLSVPADEDQNACALCGEPFDDFYSDEKEEWMYRGAVYMNAPDGSTTGMDKSEMGPIVHAKCRSESNVVPAEDFGHVLGVSEEGSQRKRLRS